MKLTYTLTQIYLKAIEDTLNWLYDGCFNCKFDGLFNVMSGDVNAVLDITDKRKVAVIILKDLIEENTLYDNSKA